MAADKTKQKIFCIGFNKTGTCSLTKALQALGFRFPLQSVSESLLSFYVKGNFDPIIDFSDKYDAFQDVPYSLPDTYKHLYESCPDAKFILTIRNNSDDWYASLIRSHSRLFGDLSTMPERIKGIRYIYLGWLYHVLCAAYKAPLEDPYNKDIFVENYLRHNKDVIDFFKDKPGQLLVINLSDKKSYQKMCQFLDLKPLREEFPWLNRTR